MIHIEKHFGKAHVNIYESRSDMGRAAARHVETLIQTLLKEQPTVNMIFAAAPSQNEFLWHLSQSTVIDWSRVVAFHMDEYFELPAESDQFFGKFLTKRLFGLVPLKNLFLLNSLVDDPQKECGRYSDLLRTHPPDIVCMGIGENGHIAFNDPPVADFNDPVLVKIIELDEHDREQQVHDGCFPSIKDVPVHAFTLTIPALMSARYLSVVVPTGLKAVAVQRSLTGPVVTDVPASILRTHENTEVFLDEDAAALLS